MDMFTWCYPQAAQLSKLQSKLKKHSNAVQGVEESVVVPGSEDAFVLADLPDPGSAKYVVAVQVARVQTTEQWMCQDRAGEGTGTGKGDLLHMANLVQLFDDQFKDLTHRSGIQAELEQMVKEAEGGRDAREFHLLRAAMGEVSLHFRAGLLPVFRTWALQNCGVHIRGRPG